MNEVVTAPVAADLDTQCPSDTDTGGWSEGFALHGRPAMGRVRTAGLVVATALLLMSQPTNGAVTYPWESEGSVEASTTLSQMISSPRRRVSLAEARRISLAILAECEQRRQEYADREAAVPSVLEEEFP